MTEIRKQAVQIQQGKRVLYMTTFTVKDFNDDFYRVDRLNVEEFTGMQRLLNKKRVNEYSRDIISSCQDDDVFLPTSVFLATEGDIGYDESTNELFFDSSASGGVCPFYVVDGQHRVEGFKHATMKLENEHLLNFPISTVIAPNLIDAERMLQFIIVNNKQKSVDKGVAQHIISQFTEMDGIKELPHFPNWLEREIEKGDVNRALNIVKALNKDVDSPWRGRIKLADETKKRMIVQSSFVTLIKKHLLSRNHPLLQISEDVDVRMAILKNFWKAVENIFTDVESCKDSIVFKYTGAEFFLMISAPVMNQLARKENYTVKAFEECIRSASDALDGGDERLMHPEYWQKGGDAGGLNASSKLKLVTLFSNALAKANSVDIEL